MNNLAKLSKLERFARDVSDACAVLLPDPDGGGAAAVDVPAALRPLVQQIANSARDLGSMVTSPVKIGVVGEFSAGKTLLLGALTGYADRLPIDEAPTTGNVTAIHFLQGEGTQTETEEIRIEYLNEDQVALCLAFLLLEARARGTDARLPSEAMANLQDLMGEPLEALNPDKIDTLDAAQRGSLLDPDRLAGLQTWCQVAWKTENPGLRSLIRELLAFVRAYSQCGPAFCRHPREYKFTGEAEIEKAVVGLRLPEADRDLPSLSFADLPPPPPALDTAPESLSSAAIRHTFPLIRRVHLVLRMPKSIWNLGHGEGETDAPGRFVLLDFPGLGADSSGARDLYLCLNELKEVQTILILLRGDKPGGDQGHKLYNYMQRHKGSLSLRDNILVGIGRFDQLPLDEHTVKTVLPALGGKAPGAAPARATASAPAKSGKAAKLLLSDDEEEAPPPVAPAAAGAASKVTEDHVLEQVPILKRAIAGAEALSAPDRKDRIVFLSPMRALKALADDNPTLRLGSDSFRNNLAGNARLSTERAALWRDVTEQLDAAAPGARMRDAGLARWLDDFVTDGGLGRLRALLASHVQRFGVTQLCDTARGKAEELQQELRKLDDKLGPASGYRDVRTWEDRIDRGRSLIRELSQVYQDRLADLKARPELPVTRDGKRVQLTDVLLEEVADEVYRWPQWRTLLEAGSGGEIREPKPRAGGGPAGPGGLMIVDDDYDGPTGGEGFPNTSDSFYANFEATLRKLDERVRALIGVGIENWLGELAAKVAHARDDLSGPLDADGLRGRIQRLALGQLTNGLVAAMKLIIRPDGKEFRERLLPEGKPENLQIPVKLVPDALFPLARSRRDKTGKPLDGHQARTFAWAAAVQQRPEPSRPPRHHAHQAQAYRLRDDIVTTLAQQTAQVLAAGVQQVVETLIAWLGDFTTRLPFVVSEDRLLEELFRPADAPEAPLVDPLQPVRRLAALGRQNLDTNS